MLQTQPTTPQAAPAEHFPGEPAAGRTSESPPAHTNAAGRTWSGTSSTRPVGFWDGSEEKGTQKRAAPELAASRAAFSLGIWALLDVSGRRREQGELAESTKQDADRTEKEIFGIFGIINTIKITNGKVSEVASLVLTRNRKVFSGFFFHFSFFFFSFFCFFSTHRSSFLEAARFKGFSLFLLDMNYFPPSLSFKKPQSSGKVSQCLFFGFFLFF